MKIICPNQILLRVSPLLSNQRDLVVSSVVGFPLVSEGPFQFLSDQDIIAAISKDPNFDIPWDNHQPKHSGEFIVIGSIYGNNDKKLIKFSVSCGSISKEVYAHAEGNISDSLFGKKAIDQNFIQSIPIRYPQNLLRTSDSNASRRLCQFTHKPDEVVSLQDFDISAFVCQVPSRAQLKDPKSIIPSLPHWFANEFPSTVSYFDDELLYCAHKSQRISTYWTGSESFILKNLHPHFALIEGVLPSIQFKTFYTLKSDYGLRSTPTCIDTIVFLPDQNIGLLVGRSIIPNSGIDFTNTEYIMVAFEDINSARDDGFYMKVFDMRTDPITGSDHAFHDEQLIPSNYQLPCDSESVIEKELPNPTLDSSIPSAPHQPTVIIPPSVSVDQNDHSLFFPISRIEDSSGGFDLAKNNEALDRGVDVVLSLNDASTSNDSIPEDLLPSMALFDTLEKSITYGLNPIELISLDSNKDLNKADIKPVDVAHFTNLLAKLDSSFNHFTPIIAEHSNQPQKEFISFDDINSITHKLKDAFDVVPGDHKLSDFIPPSEDPPLSLELYEELKANFLKSQSDLDSSRVGEFGSDVSQDNSVSGEVISEISHGEASFVAESTAPSISADFDEFSNVNSLVTPTSEPITTHFDSSAPDIPPIVPTSSDHTLTNHFINVDLTDRSFSDAEIAEYYFENCNLTGVSFEKSNIKNSIFNKCNLTYAIFSQSNIESTRFDDCNLSHSFFCNSLTDDISLTKCNSSFVDFVNFQCNQSNFSSTDFSDCNFTSSKFNDLKVQNCDYKRSIYNKSSWNHVSLIKAIFNYSTFEDSSLNRVRFLESTLDHSKFTKVVLTNFSVIDSQLVSTYFNGCQATDASILECDCSEIKILYSDFSGSSLTACNFSSSQLNYSNFMNCGFNKSNLHKSVLLHSQLLGSSMRVSNLDSASFRFSVLHSADLTGATLTNSDFTDVEHLPIEISRFL